MKRIETAASLSALSLCLVAPAAFAAPTYITGHINNVTLVGDFALVMVDAGLPDNCAGPSDCWMKIPPENKAITAFILGL